MRTFKLHWLTDDEQKVSEITTCDAMKMAESHPKLTEKEREKILAISTLEYIVEEKKNGQLTVPPLIMLTILWEQSRMAAKCYGYSISDLNIERAIDMHNNPIKYKDYK